MSVETPKFPSSTNICLIRGDKLGSGEPPKIKLGWESQEEYSGHMFIGIENHRGRYDASFHIDDLVEALGLMRNSRIGRDCMIRPWPRLDDSPEIVCLCGSTRFVDHFNHWRKQLTEHGKIVLSIEIVTTQSKESDPQHIDPDLKRRLDELHLRKIDLADRVMVLNVGGYIGDSTKNEIAYAKRMRKPIDWLEAPKAEQKKSTLSKKPPANPGKGYRFLRPKPGVRLQPGDEVWITDKWTHVSVLSLGQEPDPKWTYRRRKGAKQSDKEPGNLYTKAERELWLASEQGRQWVYYQQSLDVDGLPPNDYNVDCEMYVEICHGRYSLEDAS